MLKRRILLVLTGLSPQVVTETLYGLTQKENPWVPTEVHLFTTKEGRERARLQLLDDGGEGWLKRFCEDYGLPDIRFDAACIHQPRYANGDEVADLRTPEDNQCAADSLCDLVRGFTEHEETELHVSIAGGRKTLGFYGGYALSLFGRSQDRLSHVLVDPDFEFDPQFFYPTPTSRVIFSSRHQKPLDTKDAKVTLADIPFVRMRDGLPRRMLSGTATFSETISAAQEAASATPELRIEISNRQVRAGHETLNFSPAELAFYVWFAKRRADDQPPIRWTDEGLHTEFLSVYRELYGDMDAGYERAEEALAGGMDNAYFDQRKSRVNKALQDQLGRTLAKLYQIESVGKRPNTRYAVTGVEAEAVIIE